MVSTKDDCKTESSSYNDHVEFFGMSPTRKEIPQKDFSAMKRTLFFYEMSKDDQGFVVTLLNRRV